MVIIFLPYEIIITTNYKISYFSKVNQSPDLDFRLKIRIFDLEGLRCFESKTFKLKVVETVQI